MKLCAENGTVCITADDDFDEDEEDENLFGKCIIKVRRTLAMQISKVRDWVQ